MATLFGKTVMKMLPARSLRRALVNAASDKLRWKLALPCEEKYWENYISTRGGEYGEDFSARLNPSFELQPHVRAHIAAPEGATVRILDVGAGPLTVLGKRWPQGTRTILLTAVDPLANDYARILRRNHVVAPVPTLFAAAERLTARFDPGSFDLVYSRNALDHSYSPLDAIRQMLAVCKPGCTVLLEHLINEAETERYYGLHQWNFNMEHSGLVARFVIWNKIRRVDVADILGAAATVCPALNGRWLTVAIKKALSS